MSRPHQAIAAALLLAGCTSLYPPKSADEFRRAASASLLPKTGSLEVARPLPQVSDDLRKKSAECLDVSVTAVTKTITDFQEIIRTYYVTYKPTVVAAPERTELHVQWHTKGDIHLSRAPEGGAYRLIVDAYPAGGGRTRLQWFSPTSATDFLTEAVKGWATGENMACPDLKTQW